MSTKQIQKQFQSHGLTIGSVISIVSLATGLVTQRIDAAEQRLARIEEKVDRLSNSYSARNRPHPAEKVTDRREQPGAGSPDGMLHHRPDRGPHAAALSPAPAVKDAPDPG